MMMRHFGGGIGHNTRDHLSETPQAPASNNIDELEEHELEVDNNDGDNDSDEDSDGTASEEDFDEDGSGSDETNGYSTP